MTIVTTMCKLLFAMLIGFYLFKKDILTKEVNAETFKSDRTDHMSMYYSEQSVYRITWRYRYDPEAVSGGSGDVCDLSNPVLDHHKDHASTGCICVGLTCACLFFQIVHLWVIRWYRRYMVTARFSILRSSTCHSVSCFSPWVCICWKKTRPSSPGIM